MKPVVIALAATLAGLVLTMHEVARHAGTRRGNSGAAETPPPPPDPKPIESPPPAPPPPTDPKFGMQTAHSPAPPGSMTQREIQRRPGPVKGVATDAVLRAQGRRTRAYLSRFAHASASPLAQAARNSARARTWSRWSGSFSSRS